MRTVEIPGGTARFRGKEELRGRDSKLVKAAMMAAQSALVKLPEDQMRRLPGETDEETARRIGKILADSRTVFSTEEALSLLNLKEAIVIAYLVDWTLDLPLPTLETIGDLPGELYEALDAAAGGPLLNAAIGTDFSPSPPPKPGEQPSPSGPSSDSAGSLREESSTAEMESISRPLTNGVPTSIERSTADSLTSST